MVEGAFNSQAASVQYMGVDHGGFDVFVSEEFLNRADVVSALEEVCGEGVAEGVGGDSFFELGDFCGAANFAL